LTFPSEVRSSAETSITTLVDDIYSVLEKGAQVPPTLSEEFGKRVADMITSRLTQSREPKPGELRMSRMGEPDRKLWYHYNQPEKAEKMDSQTLLKFLYGDLIEELILFLAQVSGHRVEHRQREVSINGVPGHIDAIIDGVLVDVKSASPFSFEKFVNRKLEQDDPFGYKQQLFSYLESLQASDDLKVKGEGTFLVADKVDGRLVVSRWKPTQDGSSIKDDYSRKIALVKSETPPAKCFPSVPMGASGNEKLGTRCAYCVFKRDCWKDANGGTGLQEYQYSGGSVYLTKVVKEPKVDRKF
jgi:hypothetical protein